MTNYLEAVQQIKSALGADDPQLAYRQLVDQGMDLSELTEAETLLLVSRFAGNQCVIFRGLSSEQRAFAARAMNDNHLYHGN